MCDSDVVVLCFTAGKYICDGFCKNPMDYGLFLPIWNKIQNIETVSGSFRPWVVSVGSFRPIFAVSAMIGGVFRPDF